MAKQINELKTSEQVECSLDAGVFLNQSGQICFGVYEQSVCFDLSNEELLTFANALIDLLIVRIGRAPVTEDLLKMMPTAGEA